MERYFNWDSKEEREMMYKYIKMITGIDHIADMNEDQLRTFIRRLEEIK